MKIKFLTAAIILALVLGGIAGGQHRKQAPAAKPRAMPSPSPLPTATPTPKPTPDLSSLEDFDDIKSSASFSKTLWSLSINYQEAEYPAKTALNITDDLEKGETLEQHKELRAYQPELKTIALRIGVLGGSLTYFLYGKGASFPFQVARYKGTKCFVVRVATDTVYNTLRASSAKQRAAKVASSQALPILRELARILKEKDIETLVVFVTYGTKDFLEKSASATKAEVLAILSSKSDAQAFASGEQSDNEFLRKAIVLISDRDANDFSKVDLQLE